MGERPWADHAAKSRRRLNVFARVGSIGRSNLLAQASRTVSPPSASCTIESIHQGPAPPRPAHQERSLPPAAVPLSPSSAAVRPTSCSSMARTYGTGSGKSEGRNCVYKPGCLVVCGPPMIRIRNYRCATITPGERSLRASIAASVRLRQPCTVSVVRSGHLSATATIAASVSFSQHVTFSEASLGHLSATAMIAASVSFLQRLGVVGGGGRSGWW